MKANHNLLKIIDSFNEHNIESFTKRYESFQLTEMDNDEKHEVVCTLCVLLNKTHVFKYICENYEINYNKLLEYLLTYCINSRNITETIDNIIDKIEEIKVTDKNIHLLLKHCLHNNKICNSLINYENKDIFNEILKHSSVDENIMKFCLLVATDEELIDHALLKLYNYHDINFILKLNDVNRQFNKKYLCENSKRSSMTNYDYDEKLYAHLHINPKYIDEINKYGFLIMTLKSTSCYIDKTFEILINKGTILRVVKIDKNDIKEINISLLKYIKDVENFDDFIKLNKCFLMNCVKNDDEADYLMSIL